MFRVAAVKFVFNYLFYFFEYLLCFDTLVWMTLMWTEWFEWNWLKHVGTRVRRRRKREDVVKYAVVGGAGCTPT